MLKSIYDCDNPCVQRNALKIHFTEDEIGEPLNLVLLRTAYPKTKEYVKKLAIKSTIICDLQKNVSNIDKGNRLVDCIRKDLQFLQQIVESNIECHHSIIELAT